MQLNIFTDIGLKSLMYLKQANELVRIDEIAEQLVIPKNHLIKVLNFMIKQKWISSVRGRYGGVYYLKSSDNLLLGNLIIRLENKQELLNCSECKLQNSCFLRVLLKESVDCFYNNLNKYKLSDINSKQTQEFIQSMHQRYK
jgi:Rrf2 family transcriptional regulator, nitric oxide-sensitive transcriptional repressor